MGALLQGAGDVNTAAVRLHDAAGEREAQACAFRTSGEEGAENFGERVGRNAAAGVFDMNDGVARLLRDTDGNGTGTGDGLNAIERQIQDDLLNQGRIVADVGQSGARFEVDLDGFGQNLLARELDGLFDGEIEVGRMEIQRTRPGVGKQVIQDGLNVDHFFLDFAKNAAARAFWGQFLAEDFDDTGNARQWIADFVGEPGGQFAERGKMLGTLEFATVELADFVAILLELLNHFVELTAETADIVDAASKTDSRGKIAGADMSRWCA